MDIKMDFKEIDVCVCGGGGGSGWIRLAQNEAQWRTSNFLVSWVTISFPRIVLLRVDAQMSLYVASCMQFLTGAMILQVEIEAVSRSASEAVLLWN
jgi:hypothetical protein